MRALTNRRVAPVMRAGSRSSAARLRSMQARGTRAAMNGAPAAGAVPNSWSMKASSDERSCKGSSSDAPRKSAGYSAPLWGELKTAQDARSAGRLSR